MVEPCEECQFQKAGTGLTAADVARAIGGTIVKGDPSLPIAGVSGLRGAGPSDISFIANRQYVRVAAETLAAALVVPEGLELPDTGAASVLIRVRDMNVALGRLTDLFAPPEPPPLPGIHPSAVVGRSVTMGTGVSVGACAVIEDDVCIGEGTTIGAHCFLGRGAVLGRHTILHPHVTICGGCRIGNNVVLHSGVVVGGHGFGYMFRNGRHERVRQIGTVVIEDDVEIGSNTTIDRARFGATRIGRGTKIDNLVMIAHNVQIGEHCIITGQCGIAGSAVMGNYVTLGAKAGLADHVKMGDGSIAAGRAGVSKDVPPGGAVMGMPAEPVQVGRRRIAAVRKLPELIETVKELRKKVDRLLKKDEATAKDD